MLLVTALTRCIIQGHFLVSDRHHWVLELLPEVTDGLVDKEHSYSHQQQINKEENYRKNIL